MALLDLKSLNSALDELQQERGISRDSVIDATFPRASDAAPPRTGGVCLRKLLTSRSFRVYLAAAHLSLQSQ